MSQADSHKNLETAKPLPAQSSESYSAAVPACRSVCAYFRLGIVAILGLAADLATKYLALVHLGSPDIAPPQPRVLIEGYLRLVTVFNTGAVAGVGAGKTVPLIIASLFALIVLFWLFVHSRAGQWFLHLALGLLLAGALGNLHDRIFNQGRVVDFIEVNLHVWPADPWPVFNLADMFLCLGVGLLILFSLFTHKGHSKN